MAKHFPVKVHSEVDKLQTVVVHRPDDGIEIVTPGKALEFLYDDIVYLKRMRSEHQIFTDVLKAFLGKDQVLDTEELLLNVLKKSPEHKAQLIRELVEWEEVDEYTYRALLELDDEELVYVLITGMNYDRDTTFFPPLPNNVFTRDIAAVVNDHIIICQASKEPRTRENLLCRYIVYGHPRFADLVESNRIIDLTREPDEVTMEGGDIMVFDKDTLMIGCSERTSALAIDLVRDRLFERGVIKHLVKIEIPNERSAMHIDTLFTQVSRNEYVVFAPYLLREEKVKITMYTRGEESTTSFPTLKEFMLSINPAIDFILCGNGEYPHDEREQWTDGCNLVAVKDGVAIAYQRNEHTAKALKKRGYKIVGAKTLLKSLKNKLLTKGKVEKTIITIPSTELSRARGGPHCMTFPVSRG